MGNEAVCPLNSPLMSPIFRIRPLRPTCRPPMRLLMDRLSLGVQVRCQPIPARAGSACPHRYVVRPSRGPAPGLVMPPGLQLLPRPPPRGPLMQLSLRMALSLLTQPMGNSWQPRGLQDCRMVANPLRQMNLNPARRVNKEPSLPQVAGSYLMMPVPSPPSYPPTS